MSLTPRPYQEGDLEKLKALLRAAWNRWGAHTAFHIGDLLWRMRDESYEQQLWLWEDKKGRLVAFSELTSDNLEFQVHPNDLGKGVEETILAWAEDQFRQLPADEKAEKLHAWAADGDAKWIAFLKRRGYECTEAYFNFNFRSLETPIETPPVPDGFVIRSLRDEAEVEARVAGHRAAWEPSKMTVEKYLRMMRLPGYRVELDMVAVAPDGTIASNAICWLDEANGVGEFEPVGTHPAFRRLGLGKAVMMAGCRKLQELGAKEALVLSWHASEPANRLYASCGFRVRRRDFQYAASIS